MLSYEAPTPVSLLSHRSHLFHFPAKHLKLKKKAEEKERMNIVDEIHHPFRKINGEQHDFSDPKQFENKDLVILEMQLFHQLDQCCGV